MTKKYKIQGWKGLLESKWWMWLPFTYLIPKFKRWVYEPEKADNKIERLNILTSNKIITLFFCFVVFYSILILIFNL
jgi:hypothetical protein